MNEKRLTKLSDIAGNIGLVFFASAFLDPIIKGSVDLKIIVFGLIFAVGGWLISLILLQ